MHLNQDYFIRERQIIKGDPTAQPPVKPMLPVSHSHCWSLIKAGKFPQPIRLGKRCSVWRMSDIEQFINDGGVQK
jgi:prophage regulatory protein